MLNDIPPDSSFMIPKITEKLNRITPYGSDKCKWGGLKSTTFDEKRAISRKRYKIDA